MIEKEVLDWGYFGGKHIIYVSLDYKMVIFLMCAIDLVAIQFVHIWTTRKIKMARVKLISLSELMRIFKKLDIRHIRIPIATS